MNKSTLLVILLALSFNCIAQQVKKYEQVSKTVNSDFNYEMILKLDSIGLEGDSFKTSQIFEPIKGNYTVYQFIAKFKGESVLGGIDDFHNLLIVKVDNKNLILDSYQYTLEWSESPLDYDLFKGSSTGVVLKDGLKIEKLKLVRSWDGEKELLSESGILNLKE